jgi:hypothetical protein
MKGLLIRPPWIDRILAGEKTWELRSRRTHLRERIALIEAGAGRVVGTAEVVGCEGPLDAAALVRSRGRHLASPQQVGSLGYTQTFAWVLANVRRLDEPLPYRHPVPATIWVTLNAGNCPRYAELSKPAATSPAPAGKKTEASRKKPASSRAKASPTTSPSPAPAALGVSPSASPAPLPPGRDDRFCRSFGIRLEDDTIVHPFRVRDRSSGRVGFKLSRRGNTNDDAELVEDEDVMRSMIASGSYRVRASRLDGSRAGLVLADATRLVPRKT